MTEPLTPKATPASEGQGKAGVKTRLVELRPYRLRAGLMAFKILYMELVEPGLGFRD